MSKLTARAENGKVVIAIDDDIFRIDMTLEKSRALRAELEQAEKEAEKKSAFETFWGFAEWATDRGLAQDAWNAAIDAAIIAILGTITGQEERLRALKEPTE